MKDHRQKRSQAWLDYIGYTRDKTVKTEKPYPSDETVQQIQQQVDLMRNAK